MASSGTGIKRSKLLSSEKPNVINKMDGAINVTHTKFIKELSIPVRQVMTKCPSGQLQNRMCQKCCKSYKFNIYIQ